MIGNILIVLFFLLSPAGILWLCRKVKICGKIGPVLLLYILGAIVGNIVHPSGLEQIQQALSNAMIPLAIPLMLFACTFSKAQTRSQMIALVTGLVAVLAAVISGYYIFGPHIRNSAKIAGMMTASYTGGTINMASLKTMLDIPDMTFILLNSYDMVVCFFYLTFLLSIGIKLFRRWLPNETHHQTGKFEDKALEEALAAQNANPYAGLFSKAGLKDAGFLLLLDVLIIGVSAALGKLTSGAWFMTVLVLMLTTLGIACSFWKPVKKRKYGYDIGMYFIYIFSVVVASMADVSKFDFSSGINVFFYLVFVVFGSLFIQVILAKIFKADADITTIASVTYICSPPFVPMIAAQMKNRDVLAPGLAIGVVGYAAGNYLGFMIASLLG